MLHIKYHKNNKTLCKAFHEWNTYHEWEFYFLQMAKEKITFGDVLCDYTKTTRASFYNNIIMGIFPYEG